MGSDSDWPVMEAAATALDEFGVPFEVDVVSAHRMPQEMLSYGARGSRSGPPGAHRRGRRGRPPAGDARVGHAAAGDRRAGAAGAPRRHGLPALDRADAGGCAGGDRVGRRGAQRRPARGAHPRRRRPRPAGADGRPSRPSSPTRPGPRARRCAASGPAAWASALRGIDGPCRPTSSCCAGSTSAPSAGSRWPTCASCSRDSGYDDVRTHLQSGNVVLRADRVGSRRWRRQVEAALATHCGFDVDVLVRTKAQLDNVVAARPLRDRATDRSRYLVVFLEKAPPASWRRDIDAGDLRARRGGGARQARSTSGCPRASTTASWPAR